jgi:hypothetical protein
MEKKIFQSGGPIIDEDGCLKTGLLLKGKNQFRRLDGVSGGTDNLRKILQNLLTLTNLQDM